ncbi:ABC transporter permease [Streptomyces sp. V4I2]|uniref:ABC transporter permease n=1 Tax=Streptomyces sp. V4I2 TaxID=3042280 RepID=UPI002780A8E5|nr:NitT/TauT family transport system permease protein [Streptomyces sp. V4I2]
MLVVWQLLVWAEVAPDYKLASPSEVWGEVREAWLQGTLLDYIWTSVSRGLLGFLLALAIGTPLGLLVARVKFVRAAIGPILSGLQSLPSVAWVPPDVPWLGLNNSMMYAVILLGAVPSIANGLVAGIDQIPPLFLRAGRTLGATGLREAWHIVMPGALPGYLAGLKQGWAFSWRSLMAAEIIVSSPDLGVGLGQLLENGRNNGSMPQVFLAIFLIRRHHPAAGPVLLCAVGRPWPHRFRARSAAPRQASQSAVERASSGNCRSPKSAHAHRSRLRSTGRPTP